MDPPAYLRPRRGMAMLSRDDSDFGDPFAQRQTGCTTPASHRSAATASCDDDGGGGAVDESDESEDEDDTYPDNAVLVPAIVSQGDAAEWGVLSPVYPEPFNVHGFEWPTLRRRILAAQLSSESDREKVRKAPTPDAARRIFESAPRLPNAEDTLDLIAVEAGRARLLQSTAFASSLRETGNRPICAPRCHPCVARALLQVRFEQDLPDYVPKELFNSLRIYAAGDFTTDAFVTKLTHRLLEKHKSATTTLSIYHPQNQRDAAGGRQAGSLGTATGGPSSPRGDRGGGAADALSGAGCHLAMSESFEKLFSSAEGLLALRRRRSEETLRRKHRVLAEKRRLFMLNLNGQIPSSACAMLDEVDEEVATLESEVTHIANKTTATAKRLSSLMSQATRVRDCCELIEHYDLFDTMPPPDMKKYIALLEKLRVHQWEAYNTKRCAELEKHMRALQRADQGGGAGSSRSLDVNGSLVGGGIGGGLDEDDDTLNLFESDEPPEVESLKEEIQKLPLQTLFAVGVFSTSIEGYATERKCVDAVGRLKVFIQDWPPSRPGVQNIHNYEAFLSNLLLTELHQHGKDLISTFAKLYEANPEALRLVLDSLLHSIPAEMLQQDDPNNTLPFPNPSDPTHPDPPAHGRDPSLPPPGGFTGGGGAAGGAQSSASPPTNGGRASASNDMEQYITEIIEMHAPGGVGGGGGGGGAATATAATTASGSGASAAAVPGQHGGGGGVGGAGSPQGVSRYQDPRGQQDQQQQQQVVDEGPELAAVRKVAEGLADHIRLRHLSQMRIIVRLVGELGKGYTATEFFVTGIFQTLDADLQGGLGDMGLPELALSDTFGSARQKVPAHLTALLETLETTVRRQTPVVRHVFPTPHSVLKRIVDRYMQDYLTRAVESATSDALMSVSNARRIQDLWHTFPSAKAFADRLDAVAAEARAAQLPGAPPVSPRTEKFYQYSSEMPDDTHAVNQVIYNDLSAFCKRLFVCHREVLRTCRMVGVAAPEVSGSLAHHVENIFSECVRTYIVAEPMSLDAFLCFPSGISAVGVPDPSHAADGTDGAFGYSAYAASTVAAADASDSSSATVSVTVYVRKGSKAAEEAIDRVNALCPEARRQAVIEKMYDLLTQHVYKRVTAYVRSALLPLQDELRRPVCGEDDLCPPGQAPASPQQPTGLHVVTLNAVACAVTVLEMLEGVLKGKFAKALPPHRERVLAARSRGQLEDAESLLGTAVGHAVSYITTHALGILLKHQKKDDFRPHRKEGAVIMAHDATYACERYSHYLRKQIDCLVSTLSGTPSTLRSASELLCKLLLRGLKAHLKAFIVAEEGALRLKRDVAEYCAVMAALPTNANTAAFERIRDLANLFIVCPTSLKDLTTQACFAGLSAEDLQGFLKMRPDWKDIKSKFQLPA